MKRTPQNRRLRWLVLALIVALAVGAGAFVREAWNDTRRREAYLGDLSAGARRDPLDGKTQALLAARLIDLHRYDEAAAALQQSLLAGLKDDCLWRSWAACDAVRNAPERAKETLAKALTPGRCDRPEAIRDALQRWNALPTGADGLAQAAAISPEGSQDIYARFAGGSVLNGLSDILARRDLEKSGFSFRQRQAALHPTDAEAQALWADALRKNRILVEAEPVAREALRLDPKSARARLALADILRDGGAAARAGAQYRAALDLRPDFLSALRGMGAVSLQLKLPNKAIQSFEKATQIDPKDPEAWIGLGQAFFMQRLRFDLAEDAYRKAMTLAPERTDFFVHVADVLFVLQRFEEGEGLLKKRLEAAPGDARAHYLLATALLDDRQNPERTAQAEEHLRASMRLQPDAPAVKIRLAQILLDKEGPNAAADAGILLTEALEAEPREPTALRLMIRAYRRIGKPERAAETEKLVAEVTRYIEAVRELESREAANPRDLKIHEELAQLYREGGDPEKARRQEEMIHYLKLYPARAGQALETLVDATSAYATHDAPPSKNAK